MDCASIISIIKDILLGLSAISVALFAWFGLKTWRKELTGKAKFETARNMMHTGLELKANLEWVRHPLLRSNEYTDRIVKAEETAPETAVLNNWYAKNIRLNPAVESRNKIINIQWEAETLLDESSVISIKEAIQSFRESYANLSTAIEEYFDIQLDAARTGVPYNDQDYLKALSKIIYSAQNDDFSKKVDEALDKLSSALKQYVK